MLVVGLITVVIVLILVGLAIMWAGYVRSRGSTSYRRPEQPAPVLQPEADRTGPTTSRPTAVPAVPEPVDTTGRRRFLAGTIYVAMGAMVTTLAVPALRYFIYPALRRPPPTQFTPIASLAEFQIGVPTFVTYEERVMDGWVMQTRSKGAWVIYKGENRVVVFDPHCTHLGCGYSWNSDRNQFLCPCHAGVFDIDGAVVSGPPPRPLDPIEHKISDGSLLVGRTIKSTDVRG